MTRKDYELIARVIRTVNIGYVFADTRRALTDAFADALEADNPRFDPETFRAACALPSSRADARQLRRDREDLDEIDG